MRAAKGERKREPMANWAWKRRAGDDGETSAATPQTNAQEPFGFGILRQFHLPGSSQADTKAIAKALLNLLPHDPDILSTCHNRPTRRHSLCWNSAVFVGPRFKLDVSTPSSARHGRAGRSALAASRAERLLRTLVATSTSDAASFRGDGSCSAAARATAPSRPPSGGAGGGVPREAVPTPLRRRRDRARGRDPAPVRGGAPARRRRRRRRAAPSRSVLGGRDGWRGARRPWRARRDGAGWAEGRERARTGSLASSARG
jgi:hypothetical protein